MTGRLITGCAGLFAALLLASPIARAADSGERHLTGNEARALALAFQTIGAGVAPGQGGSAFGGVTVHVASMPSCYRFSFVSDADPSVHSTLRFAKPQGESDGSPCSDAPAKENSIPGAEAEAIVRVVQAWSRGELAGAPGLETLSSGAFNISEKLGADGRPIVDLILAGAACALPFTYAPADGKIVPLARPC